jgi:ligand-binding SRPBCC domain-containing protein
MFDAPMPVWVTDRYAEFGWRHTHGFAVAASPTVVLVDNVAGTPTARVGVPGGGDAPVVLPSARRPLTWRLPLTAGVR